MRRAFPRQFPSGRIAAALREIKVEKEIHFFITDLSMNLSSTFLNLEKKLFYFVPSM